MQLSRKRQMKARDQRSPRAVLWRQIALGVGIVIAIILLITAIWYGTRVQSLTIQNIEVVGGETISHEEVRTLVADELIGTYYRLVPKQFAWTYPRARITEQIGRVPRVKNVAVDRVSGTELSVIFEEYQPFALWCSDVDGSQCIFIDRNGYAFAKAPTLVGGAFVRYVDSSLEMETGNEIFSPEFVRRTNEFIETAYQDLNLNIVTVEKTGLQEVSYHIAGGGFIRTSLLETYDDTIENLVTILESNQFNHLEPGNFKYIDLRFGNRVFVNEELAPANASVASSSATSTQN